MLKILKFYLFPIWFPLFIIFFILLLILSTFITTKIYLISLSSICLLINIILKIIAKFKNSFNFDIRIVFIINRILFIVFLLLGIYNVSNAFDKHTIKAYHIMYNITDIKGGDKDVRNQLYQRS